MFDVHDRMSLSWAAFDSFRGKWGKDVCYLKSLTKIYVLSQIFNGFTVVIILLNKRNALSDAYLSRR